MNEAKPRPETAREAALIGALVTFSGAIEDVPPQLEAADFTDRDLGACWAAIKARHAGGHGLNPESVAADLPPQAADALEEAASCAATAAHVATHATEIIRSAAARRLRETLARLEAGDLDAIVSDVSAALEAAKDRTVAEAGDDVFIDTATRMSQLLDYADKAMRGENQGHRIGLSKLDRLTGGIRPGTTWIIGARPSAGKSTLLVQMADAVARGGACAVLVSAEMPVLEIAKREAASASGINSLRINEGKLSADEWAKLTRAAGEMVNRQSDRLVMADKLGTDIEKIVHAMRQRRRQGRLDVLLIDYVQKLYARRLVGKGANRNTELEVVGNMLADFARETGVAVVIASQLKRGQGEPSMDSLRDSGALEAAADVIALIHREDEETEERDIIIAKNRQGPTSRMYTVLKSERMQFYEIQKSDGGQA